MPIKFQPVVFRFLIHVYSLYFDSALLKLLQKIILSPKWVSPFFDDGSEIIDFLIFVGGADGVLFSAALRAERFRVWINSIQLAPHWTYIVLEIN